MADDQHLESPNTAESDIRRLCSSQNSTSDATLKSNTDNSAANFSNAEGVFNDPCGSITYRDEALVHRNPAPESRESNIHSSPKRGPTLSTSTSSFEALDPHDPNLSHLASLMFSHTSSYLQVSFCQLGL